MKVFHIELAKTGKSLSGGEKSMIENILFLQKKRIKNILVTTDNGRLTYEKLGLIESNTLEYITIQSFDTEKFHIFISYIYRLFLISKIKPKITSEIDYSADILVCHSDFFPNTITTFYLSKYFNKNVFWWFHMKAPHIFKGYSGEYTNKIFLPSLSLIHYHLNQWLFFKFAKNGTVITVNEHYGNLLRVKGFKTYVLKKFGGVDQNLQIQNINKKYDLIFLGRFHSQKGLLEIPDILSILKNKFNRTCRLLIIGGGDDSIKKELIKKLRALEVDELVDFAGGVIGGERLTLVQTGKIFLFPSYYESFGLVALEAMSMGLPVVAYDLPVFNNFNPPMVCVEILNNYSFAEEISKLLSYDEYFQKKKFETIEFASTYSWEKTGKELYDLYLSKI